MTVITIRDNFPEIARQLKTLQSDIGEKVLSRALKATAKQGQTAMARAITKEFRVSLSDAKESLSIQESSYFYSHGNKITTSVELWSSRPYGLFQGKTRGTERGLNMIRFVVKEPTRNKKGKLGQVMLQIKRTGGRKYIKGAFIATNKKTGGRALFVRVGKSSMPIETKTTLDFQQMFNTKRINFAVRKIITDRLEKNFNRELGVVLRGFAK